MLNGQYSVHMLMRRIAAKGNLSNECSINQMKEVIQE
mgnify:CR=1 FL=1